MLTDGETNYIYLVHAELAGTADEQAWNDWYDDKHIPELLSVPGFISAYRFRERSERKRYLAGYRLERPDVFEEPRYREITGWAEWKPHIAKWSRAAYRVTKTDFPPV
jgi:hypothetical protein